MTAGHGEEDRAVGGPARHIPVLLDEVIAGAAIIEESGSTTIVPPGCTVRTIFHGELLMERPGHG